MAKGESYEEFVEKFEPKKTTDDCYTPPSVYAVIRDWACAKYGIDPSRIVRPFWPGGDYEHFEYPEGCVVLDNPPFSILSKICEFYLDREIPFFLFAPSLTAFSNRKIFNQINHIICDSSIVYENGAVVRTSFLTSYGGDIVAQTAPDLTRLVNDEVKRLRGETSKPLPKYVYPYSVITAAVMQKYNKYGIEWRIHRKDCVIVRELDAQRAEGKAIYGGGVLLSEKKAAEREAMERETTGRETITWNLSEREREIIKNLG